MKDCKNFIFLTLLVTFTIFFNVIAEAGIVTDRVPIQCYVDKRVSSYNQPNGRAVGWIDADVDLVQVLEIRPDGWARGTHPSGKNKRVQRWFRIADLCADPGYSNRGVRVNGRQIAYRTRNSNVQFGSVTNEDVIVLAEVGNRAQIIYNVSGGYKIGWVAISAVGGRTPVQNPTNPMVQPVTRPASNKADFRLSNYSLSSPSDYKVKLSGKVWNSNNQSERTGIHVYIGGGVGAGGAFIGEFSSDSNHNFNGTLDTKGRKGNQLVVIYAVNGKESKELDRRSINIAPTSSDDYDGKVQAFINHEWYKNNSQWGWDCAAYANEFTNFVFGKSRTSGSYFNDINKIKAGDVIYLTGSPNHYVVVLYRNGEQLTTIEGNYSKTKDRTNPKNGKKYGQTIYSSTAYKIQNGQLLRNGWESKTFNSGYHFR